MRYTLGGAWLPLLLVFVTLSLSAARPFERLPAGAESYSNIETLSQTGLLDGFTLPAGELSRLEAAVLVQKALGNYGSAQLGGSAEDLLAEDALKALLGEFAEELAQLGGAPGLPAASAPGGGELEHRVSYLETILAAGEEEPADEEDEYETNMAELYPGSEPAEAAEDAAESIQTTLYGSFQIHGIAENTQRGDTGDVTRVDSSVYWGELGVDVASGPYSGKFSMMLNDATEEVRVYESWAQYTDPQSGVFVKAGQMLMPFGDNDYYFPTYPATNDLGFITAHGLGGGVQREAWDFSVYAYDPRVQLTYEEDNVTDYTAVLAVHQQADECQDGYKLVAGYNTHLGSDDLRIAGEGPHHKRVPAYSLFARYDWGGNRYHLLADYTAALEEFDAADLDANGDNIGDKPSALNCEFVYEPEPDRLWGLSYQVTSELADYAEQRYGVLWGRRLNDLALLKLEYTHGEYGDYVTETQQSDDIFVAEVSIDF